MHISNVGKKTQKNQDNKTSIVDLTTSLRRQAFRRPCDTALLFRSISQYT